MAGPNYRLVIGNKVYVELEPQALARDEAGSPSPSRRSASACARLTRAADPRPLAGRKGAGAVGRRSRVWDSLAIIEIIADRHPEHAHLAVGCRRPRHCPLGRGRDAFRLPGVARALPDGNRHARAPDTVPEPVISISAASSRCGLIAARRFGGTARSSSRAFSIADAMYAPVASRFRTYLADLTRFGDDGTAAAYVETVFAMPAMAEWIEGARASWHPTCNDWCRQLHGRRWRQCLSLC